MAFNFCTGFLTFETVIPELISVPFGQSSLINCSAKGHPTPTLMWYRDGIQIESGNQVSVTFSGNSSVNESSLKMTSLTFDDTGVYECVAVNTLSLENITQSFFLDVVGGMKL